MNHVPYSDTEHAFRLLRKDVNLYYPIVSEGSQVGYDDAHTPFVLLEQHANPALEIKKALAKNPGWLNGQCAPLTQSHDSLLQTLLSGKIKRLPDAKVAKILSLLPIQHLDGALEKALMAGRFLTAETLWKRGCRFTSPPTALFLAQSLLYPFQKNWALCLDIDSSGGKQSLPPEFGRAFVKQAPVLPASLQSRTNPREDMFDKSEAFLKISQLWLNRTVEAGIDLTETVKLQLVTSQDDQTQKKENRDVAVPLMMLAALQLNEWPFPAATELQRQSYGDLWITVSHASHLDWNQTIENWTALDSQDDLTLLLKNRMGWTFEKQLTEVSLDHRIAPGAAAAARLRM